MSIILTDISKRFGDHLVVNRVNLEIQNGELFVLLGGSGSGKSTILRIISGLAAPDTGRIELNGLDVTGLPPQSRGIGFVFQNYSIFRHMTVAENIEFGLRIRKVPAEERKQRREELLDLVGLAGMGSRYSDQLSGGQRQRVALARALAYNPAVLLLDEPFGALDVKIRAQLRGSLKVIQNKLNVTTILVTHDQEEAFELADRIGVIDRGSLIEVGHPEDLYHRPRTEFVATFIGGGNVLVGRVAGNQIRLGSINLPFPENGPPHEEGSPARILVRPETVLLQPDTVHLRRDAVLFVRGTIVERIFAGSQQRVRVEVDSLQGIRPIAPAPAYGERIAQIEAAQINSPDGERFTPGQSVWVGFERFHVLEPTGLKVLICRHPSTADEAVVDFGCRLAEAARGPTTILTVIAPNASRDEAQDMAESLRPKNFSHLPNLVTKICQGEAAREIILEAQQGHYEVVVLGRQGRAPSLSSAGFSSIAQQILTHAVVPVLLIGTSRPALKRVLICTAAGEPGKQDVLFGGRLARQTGARATVLHILKPGSTRAEVQRVDRHMRQAQGSLEAMGVQSECRIEERSPLLQGILEESEQGDYDLIVIGAPMLPHPQQLRWIDMASQTIRGTNRPILVVPMVP